jgi:hypothetical protein
MDANQRSEVNNQTNNLANEKWTPGSKGKTADGGPLDHTYPEGLGAQQQDQQGVDKMGADPGAQLDGGGNRSATPGGSMQTQISGGSGTTQGITDSHQRQMEQKSGAYGILEEPVGHGPHEPGVNVNAQGGSADLDRGSMQSGRAGSGSQGGGGNTGGGGMHGPQSAPAGLSAGSATGNRQQGSSLYVSDNSNRGGGMAGPSLRQGQTPAQGGQEAQQGNTQLGVSGSHSMANQNSDAGGVHQSNDVAGGLPRSPGNSGAMHTPGSTDRAGSQTGAGAADSGPPAHDSNDAAGGYPRSPGYANRLAGDRNMDDDTGFKRKP